MSGPYTPPAGYGVTGVTGAGASPAGTTPAGYGAIGAAPAAPTLAPLPDPTTGLSCTGRYINPSTGDYQITADGRWQGMGTVPQLVLLAIKAIDVSALMAQGKAADFARALSGAVQVALADLIKQKLVMITSVNVIDRQPGVNPDAGIAIVNWFDLTTGEPQQTPF